MPTSVLLVEDEALRSVLEIALRADGYVVRTAAVESEALDALTVTPAALIILDMTAAFAEAILSRLHRDAPGTPQLLLVPAWDERPPPGHPTATVLEMPFDLEQLRSAVAAALGTRSDGASSEGPDVAFSL
jgi:DNA-binding NtrC family response regulator